MALSAAIVSVGIGAVGAYTQYEGAQDAKAAAGKQADALNASAAEQRAQFASQQRIADIKNARDRANMARQERVARAGVIASGANAGVSQSSGVLGGVGSIGSQGAANVGYFNSVSANQNDILSSQSRQGGDMADYGMAGASLTSAQADISMGQNIFNIGTSIFGASGGFKTIFDGGKKAA